MNAQNFTKNVKVLRENIGLNKTEFAERLGIDRSRWSNVELGRSEADYALLLHIGSYFNLSLDWFFIDHAYLMQVLEESKKTGKSIPKCIPNSIPNAEFHGPKNTNELEPEYKIKLPEDYHENIINALREVINTKNALIDSLNIQIYSLNDKIKILEKRGH